MHDETYELDQNNSNKSTAQSLDDFSGKSQKAYQELETSVADDMSGADDDFDAFSILLYKSDFTVSSKRPRGDSADISRVSTDSSYSLVNTIDESNEETTSKSLSSDFNGLSAELEEFFISESSENIDFSYTGELNEFSNDMRNQQYNEFENATIQLRYSRFIAAVVTEEMKLAHAPSTNEKMDTSMPSVTSREPNEPFVSLDTSDKMKTSEQRVVDYFVDKSVTADDSTEESSFSSGDWSIFGKKVDKSSGQKMSITDEIWKTNNLKIGDQEKTFPDSSLKDLYKENGGNKMKDSSSERNNNLEDKAKTSSVFDSDTNQAGRSTGKQFHN